MLDFSVTIAEAKPLVIHALRRGLVPMLKSSPGLGKSSLGREVANDIMPPRTVAGKEVPGLPLKVIDLRLSQCAPEDLQGLPFRDPKSGRAAFTPFDFFPLEGDKVPEGYAGWLLLLDEFNSASKGVQAASYKLVLDRYVGDHKLHAKCLVMTAGNLETDGAIVNKMSTANQSRLVHLTIRSDKDAFINWAIREKIDPRIIAFVEWRPDHLHDFDPRHKNDTFCCPRTWEFIHKEIKGENNLDPLLPLLAGTITPGVAVEFVGYSKEFNNIPRMAEIMHNPMTARVPTEPSTCFATLTSLALNVEDADVGKAIDYAKRFEPEQTISFCRLLIKNVPTASSEPKLANYMMEVSKQIND